jgi:hypothetical protein
MLFYSVEFLRIKILFRTERAEYFGQRCSIRNVNE